LLIHWTALVEAGRRDGVAAHGHDGTTRRALSVFNHIPSTSGTLEPDF
jgi:hypothetical protein